LQVLAAFGFATKASPKGIGREELLATYELSVFNEVDLNQVTPIYYAKLLY
jgi:hypothetical protein